MHFFNDAFDNANHYWAVCELYLCSIGFKKTVDNQDLLLTASYLRLVYFKCIGKGKLVGLSTSLELD